MKDLCKYLLGLFLILKKDKILCAKYRKGHFEGVLAVVNRFMENIHSDYLFLGEKDFQQIYLIKKYLQNKFKTKILYQLHYIYLDSRF